jgi:hypothetical protein
MLLWLISTATFTIAVLSPAVAGFILYDCKGNGAVKKIARRRLEMISGNVASYSRLLNDGKRLEEIKEVHELTSAFRGSRSFCRHGKFEKAQG